MNKLYILGLGCIMAGTVCAQNDYVTPVELEGIYMEKVSRDGNFTVGQDLFGGFVISYSTATDQIFEYEAYYPGNGNCIANNGMIVGQDIAGIEEHAAIMWNGVGQIPTSLANIGMSALNGITPDASRACGYMSNTSSEVMYIPFYVDIAPDGTVGQPVKLPYPGKDFFGAAPQYIVAIAISDDGKTIAGFVQDSSGYFSWPIVFNENEDGKWTYSLPSESLFNPDHVSLPQFPDNLQPGVNGVPEQPKYWDFMTEEELNAYREALKQDPQLLPFDYMSDEEYDLYLAAIKKFDEEFNEYYSKLIDQYWEAMAQAGREEIFSHELALSPDGKTLAINKTDPYATNPNDPDIVSTCIFNLADNTMEQIHFGTGNLVPLQILSDGTLLSMSSPSDFVPYVTYMLLPGATQFIKFTDFLLDRIPEYYYWLEDTLGMYGVIGYDPDGNPIMGDYIVTGLVSISSEMKTIVGGIPAGDGMSYVYYDPSGSVGIDNISADGPKDEIYNVFNINGIKVLETKNVDDILNLPKGIYIVNGTKIKV